jgi:hypothetical protein
MDKPHHNTRLSIDPPEGDEQPPSFDTVLNILKAERDTFPRVQPDSQPIARWQSSQSELLWDVMAGRSELIPQDEFDAIRLAVPSPSMSQDHVTNLMAAVPLLDPPVVEETILAMEGARAASQGASPALAHVPQAFWEALHAVVCSLPSRVPEALTRSASFNKAQNPTTSGGSSPMDISPPSPGWLTAPVSPTLADGDHPSAPIELSSDKSSVVQMLEPSLPHAGGEANTGGARTLHDSSPLLGISSQTPILSGESDSTGTSGRNAEHAISISSNHSSFHSSDRVSVPDMGSARRGGKMSLGKPTDQYEDVNPAVLAQARYLNVIPARDTKSITPERELSEVARSLPALQLFATTPLTDGSVFNHEMMRVAHEEAADAMAGITDELNRVREGFSHYFLRDPIELLEDPSIPIKAAHLRRAADIVAAVLSRGPRMVAEGSVDIWASLPSGDWFCLATFVTVAIARGCVRTPDIGQKGAFDVEPCKDQFLYDASLVRPLTQRDLLMAVSAQVQEELKDEGTLLPQDSVDGLRATIWRAHEGQIRAWMEREVLSVYKHLSEICLSDILDLIEREATVEEITDAMKEDIEMETRGKHLGLITQEKSKAFQAALEEARADSLREVRAQGVAEAVQKGHSYEAMLLARVEEEAKLEADRIFKSRLKSEHAKLKHKVKIEVEAEHATALAEHCSTLEEHLLSMDFNARQDFIRAQAIQLGLLDESAAPIPSPPKRAKVGVAPRTTLKVVSMASHDGSSAKSAQSAPSPAKPPPDPPSCLVAEGDELKPHTSAICMDWASSSPRDPLPEIDFLADTRLSKASAHAPGNAMVDNKETTVAVTSFRDL